MTLDYQDTIVHPPRCWKCGEEFEDEDLARDCAIEDIFLEEWDNEP